MLPAVIAGVAVVLLALWFVTNQRHLARRERQTADWDEGAQRPDLWTSAAACIHCGAQGGLVELVGDEVTYTCLACGRTHVRETRG